jgi:hypothetical protein
MITNIEKLEQLTNRQNRVEAFISKDRPNIGGLEKRSVKELAFKTVEGQKLKPTKELLAKLTGNHVEVIKNTRQATTFDFSTYVNPFRILSLISQGKFAELRADDREQFQSKVQRPWWGLQKYVVTEWLYPTTTLAQNYCDAERKYQNNKLAKLSGSPLEDITNEEIAYAKLMESNYVPMAKEAFLDSNGEYIVTKIEYYLRFALLIGVEIAKPDMKDGSLALTNSTRMTEGELYDNVKGHHGNAVTEFIGAVGSVIPLPLPKSKGGGHH